jgi:hypothetical protein
MHDFRFVVALSLIGAAGCYSDTQQQSTLREPHYVAGPPGGVIDPASGYSPSAGRPTGEPVDDTADDDAAADVAATGATLDGYTFREAIQRRWVRLKKLPESSRISASIPYGISLGSRTNATPRALSSS